MFAWLKLKSYFALIAARKQWLSGSIAGRHPLALDQDHAGVSSCARTPDYRGWRFSRILNRLW
jgi:hypothetical protein